MNTESDRAAHIRQARIYLREVRARASNRVQRNFCFVLLGWAADCRLQAMNAMAMRDLFATYDLFGAIA